eukprot:TRINITY_DN42734_c0_g1_i1.p1 TRINITY_DN42734_c0_g1~~TRINITY_DN42734_c0_g1_i1.p1  ORF type:complete len:731 (+),score=174.14 TRINITY_DN42734_c0_g1_i1:30-2195(+)
MGDDGGSEEDVAPGSRFGPLAFSGDHVELGDVIGTGAQGKVYACQRSSTGERLAAKVIDARRFRLLAEDPELAARKLEAEVRILRDAQHDHCVGLHDIFRTRRWIFLVMERLEEGELFEQIVKRKHFSEFEAKYVMRQVIDGLAFLHSKKIVHRDLKAENVLVAKISEAPPPNEGSALFDVKIADYGLSKYQGEGEGLRSLVGTPQYWAPEMLAQGPETYDERVDLWSLGVLLYVMLRGAYPFKGETANERIRAGDYDLSKGNWPKVSDEGKDLVRKLLQVNPDDRLSLEGCLQHLWLGGGGSLLSQPAALAQQPQVAKLEEEGVLPFSLQELLNLQLSLATSLELASIACRSTHPKLSASIRQALFQAHLLSQQALKVIRHYASVAQKVLEQVLPDLDLAVQTCEPNLGLDLLEMVQSWVQKMHSDGEQMQAMCTELSRLLESIAIQAREERAIESQPEMLQLVSAVGSQLSKQIQSARGRLLERLVEFVEKASKAPLDQEAQLLDTAASGDDQLLELLFLSPGVGPATSSSQRRRLRGEQELDSEEGQGRDGQKKLRDDKQDEPALLWRPVESKSDEPAESLEMHGAAELAVRPATAPTGPSSSLHPLLRALHELRRVGEIMRECTAFWGHVESTVDELSRLKDHTQVLLRHAAKHAKLKERFDQRLREYSDFWRSLLKLCESYCKEVQPALDQMSKFINKVEVAADLLDAKSQPACSM